MGKIAFLFSGQGAQYSGMGKELYAESKAARAVFELADSIRPGTSADCFTAGKEQLSQTLVTQPTLFCVALAAAEALGEWDIRPDMAAGFSLGEVTAAAYAGMLSYRDGFSLVCRRAELMQRCADQNKGVMLAILGLTSETAERAAGELDRVYAVNFNAPTQTVVACRAEMEDPVTQAMTALGGKVVKLAVSGAFHSPFMQAASEGLGQELERLTLSPPRIPLYANVTGMPYAEDFSLLYKQVSSPVRWSSAIRAMADQGADRFIEVGAGKTLATLVKRIVPGVKSYSVQDMASLQSTRKEIIHATTEQSATAG